MKFILVVLLVLVVAADGKGSKKTKVKENLRRPVRSPCVAGANSLFASKKLDIGKDADTGSLRLVSARDATIGDAAVVAGVTAGEDVDLKNNAQVNGDVVAGDKIKVGKNVYVSGQLSDKTKSSELNLPSPATVPSTPEKTKIGTENVTTTATITPGKWDFFDIVAGDTLSMSGSGIYHFQHIELGGTLDIADYDVILLVQSNVTFDASAVVSGAGSLVIYAQNINMNGEIEAAFVAREQLRFAKQSKFTGCGSAKEIHYDSKEASPNPVRRTGAVPGLPAANAELDLVVHLDANTDSVCQGNISFIQSHAQARCYQPTPRSPHQMAFCSSDQTFAVFVGECNDDCSDCGIYFTLEPGVCNLVESETGSRQAFFVQCDETFPVAPDNWYTQYFYEQTACNSVAEQLSINPDLCVEEFQAVCSADDQTATIILWEKPLQELRKRAAARSPYITEDGIIVFDDLFTIHSTSEEAENKRSLSRRGKKDKDSDGKAKTKSSKSKNTRDDEESFACEGRQLFSSTRGLGCQPSSAAYEWSWSLSCGAVGGPNLIVDNDVAAQADLGSVELIYQVSALFVMLFACALVSIAACAFVAAFRGRLNPARHFWLTNVKL